MTCPESVSHSLAGLGLATSGLFSEHQRLCYVMAFTVDKLLLPGILLPCSQIHPPTMCIFAPVLTPSPLCIDFSSLLTVRLVHVLQHLI